MTLAYVLPSISRHFHQDFMMIKEDEWPDALAVLKRYFSITEGAFVPLEDSSETTTK
jgi:hypothetical protein